MARPSLPGARGGRSLALDREARAALAYAVWHGTREEEGYHAVDVDRRPDRAWLRALYEMHRAALLEEWDRDPGCRSAAWPVSQFEPDAAARRRAEQVIDYCDRYDRWTMRMAVLAANLAGEPDPEPKPTAPAWLAPRLPRRSWRDGPPA